MSPRALPLRTSLRTHVIGFSKGEHLAAAIAKFVRDRDSGRYGLVDRVDGKIHVDYLLKRQVVGEMIRF